MIRENLPEILRYYPDYAEVHQKHIATMTDLDPATIVPANGSTEIITMLCHEAAGPMVTSVPTFGRWTDLPLELNVPLHTIQRRSLLTGLSDGPGFNGHCVLGDAWR